MSLKNDAPPRRSANMRAGLGVLWLCGLAACSGTSYQSVTVTVELPTALQTRVATLMATGSLNGTASSSGPQAFDLLMDPFTLQVAQGLRGAFQVDVDGESAKGAVVGTGHGMVQLTGEQEYTMTITLAPFYPDQTQVSFGDAVTYSEHGYPSALASGDFDGDGKPDLAAASLVSQMESNYVDLFLNQGTGTGTFKAGSSLPVSLSEGASLAAGDVNGDGKADVALAAGAVYLALNHGDGTLAAAQPIGDDLQNPAGLLLQDVDGDGKLDLVVGSGRGVRLLHGHGDGTFAAAQDFATSLNVSAVALGDLDQDGRLDLVALHQAGVQVLLGDATAGFRDGVDPTDAGKGPGTLALADLDSDGLLDLAIGRPGDLAVTVLFGKGDGTFAAAQTPAQGFMGTTIAVADFNHDYKQDVAILGIATAGGTLLLGNGDGTFTTTTFRTDTSTKPTVPVGPLVSLDANGDGRPDLALVTSQEGGFLLSVLLNTSK